mgnify:CR=1 FL=1
MQLREKALLACGARGGGTRCYGVSTASDLEGLRWPAEHLQRLTADEAHLRVVLAATEKWVKQFDPKAKEDAPLS